MSNDTKYSPDYKVTVISVCGFIGLLMGLLVLSYEGKKSHTGSVFHEVNYSPRQTVGRALDGVIDSLGGAVKKYTQQKANLDSAKVGKDDRARIINELNVHIKEDSTSVAILISYKKFYQDAPEADTGALTTLNKWLYFQLTPNDIVKLDKEYDKIGKNWSASVPYYAKFTANNKLFSYQGKTLLIVNPYSSNLQFLMKYPGVGTWVFFMLLFCVFCFVNVPASLYIREQVLLIFGSNTGPDKNGYRWSVILVAICFALLYIILFNTFSDEMPVKGLFFMRTLFGTLVFVNIIGGVSGAFCLAGFIHSASMLGHFADKLKEETGNIVAQRVVVKAKEDGDSKGALSQMEQNYEKYQDQYRKLLGFFHRYFILSAVQLSLTVLVTGALHNAANSIDFVKLLVTRWGYSPASGDAVYLYGGLYTIILLLVYLPAKMQFGDVRLELPPDPNAPKEEDSAWYSFLQQPFSLLKGSLIAATPFLSGIVQSLLDVLFKH